MARIIISLPQTLLEEFDLFVDTNKYNRSECVRHAMRMLITAEKGLTKKDENNGYIQNKTTENK